MCDCTAAWNTPNPAASALWKSKSAPALTWASAASIAAPTSSKLPVKADQQPALRPGREEAPSDSRKGQLDRGQLDSADSADHSGLGHSAGYYTRDVGCFLDLEGQRGYICRGSAPRSHDEPGLRKQLPHPERRVRVLESM